MTIRWLRFPSPIPYERYSTRGAHWFVARALSELLKGSGLAKGQIDGLCLSSFTLAPDTAVGLDAASGLVAAVAGQRAAWEARPAIVSLRRALRAVQSGDASVVACIGADTNQARHFQARRIGKLQPVLAGRRVSLWRGRSERELRASDRPLHGIVRRPARGFRQALRRAARQRAEFSPSRCSRSR